MNCERHPSRPGTLTVDLPSLGIQRYMCAECRGELETRLYTPYKGKREAWDHSGHDYHDYGEAGIAYRMPEGFRQENK